MLYETLLLIGAVGLLAQTVLGMASHGGHGGHSHADGHGHGIDFEIPHGTAGHLGHAGHVGHTGGQAAVSAAGTRHGRSPIPAQGRGGVTVQQRATAALWTLFSPLTIFSFCLGAGAAGILIRAYVHLPLFVALIAVLGGVLFYAGIVKPLWALIFKFASKPAETLNGAVASEAVAMGRFNPEGQGIVRVTVDGAYVRLLAHLESDDREKGIAVTSGDKLVVTSVDEKRNTCYVTRL